MKTHSMDLQSKRQKNSSSQVNQIHALRRAYNVGSVYIASSNKNYLLKNELASKRRLPFLMWPTTVYLFICLLATLIPGSALSKTTNESSDQKEANVAYINSSDHTQILYELLVASLATARNQPEVALPEALEAATKTNDPAIAAYSTEIAINFQAAEPAIQSAVIWANNDQNDLQAQLVAATLLIGQSIEQAKPFLKRAIELDADAINQNIISLQSKLSTRSAEHLKMALEMIAKEDPNNAYKQLIAAQSTAQQGEISNSNKWVDSALKLKPGLTQAIQLKARLIRYEDNKDTRALQYLAEKVSQFPSNSELRLFLASALMDANRLNDATNHLNKLTNDKDYGGQALLFLGEINLAERQPQKAKTFLLKAFEHKEVKDNAAYDLGEMAEVSQKPEEAIQWYGEVNPGPFQIPATVRAVNILKANKNYTLAINLLHEASPTTLEEQKLLLLTEVDILAESKQMEEASHLINEILSKLPEDIDVLFSHAIVAMKTKDYNAAENDLKNILKINANSTDALNAMGYLLTLQNTRLQEAEGYLNQAVQLSPQNPVYLANLGWIKYKLGDNQKALEYLKQAYEIKNNTEIASYLAEVLWATGDKQAAMKLLSTAYRKSPENTVLLETLDRLKIEAASLNANNADNVNKTNKN